MAGRIVSIWVLFYSLFIVAMEEYPGQEKICHSCIPFKKDKRSIVKSALFYASMNQQDARVPRIFVQTHEHIACLADWDQEYWQEFGKFQKMLELGLKKAFNASLINIACLMNAAREEGTHTHWHF